MFRMHFLTLYLLLYYIFLLFCNGRRYLHTLRSLISCRWSRLDNYSKWRDVLFIIKIGTERRLPCGCFIRRSREYRVTAFDSRTRFRTMAYQDFRRFLRIDMQHCPGSHEAERTIEYIREIVSWIHSKHFLSIDADRQGTHACRRSHNRHFTMVVVFGQYRHAQLEYPAQSAIPAVGRSSHRNKRSRQNCSCQLAKTELRAFIMGVLFAAILHICTQRAGRLMRTHVQRRFAEYFMRYTYADYYCDFIEYRTESPNTRRLLLFFFSNIAELHRTTNEVGNCLRHRKGIVAAAARYARYFFTAIFLARADT